LKNVCLVWAVAVFSYWFFRLLFLRVDCECNRFSCLAIVFYQASNFNGDLNQWDVAKVIDMFDSKSIRRFPYETSCVLFLMRFLYEVMLICCIIFLLDFLMSFHIIWPF
jgi:hypothetical protein